MAIPFAPMAIPSAPIYGVTSCPDAPMAIPSAPKATSSVPMAIPSAIKAILFALMAIPSFLRYNDPFCSHGDPFNLT